MYYGLSALLIYTSGHAITELKEGKKEKPVGLDLIMEKADLQREYAGCTSNYDSIKLSKRSAPYNCRGK